VDIVPLTSCVAFLTVNTESDVLEDASWWCFKHYGQGLWKLGCFDYA